MGVYANFIIEYKDRKTGAWTYLDAYYPFKERENIWSDAEGIHKEKTTPDAVTTDGKELTKTGTIWSQGTMRDLFGGRNLMVNEEDRELANRGIPSDASCEGREIIEKHTQSGYGWGASYATMGELEAIADRMLARVLNDLEKNYEEKYLKCAIMQKLQTIEDKLSDKGVIKNDKNVFEEDSDTSLSSEDITEYINYLKDDELWDAINIYSFISKISGIAEFLTEFEDRGEVRVLVWED